MMAGAVSCLEELGELLERLLREREEQESEAERCREYACVSGASLVEVYMRGGKGRGRERESERLSYQLLKVLV